MSQRASPTALRDQDLQHRPTPALLVLMPAARAKEREGAQVASLDITSCLTWAPASPPADLQSSPLRTRPASLVTRAAASATGQAPTIASPAFPTTRLRQAPAFPLVPLVNIRWQDQPPA